jgi:hypothetical protein
LHRKVRGDQISATAQLLIALEIFDPEPMMKITTRSSAKSSLKPVSAEAATTPLADDKHTFLSANLAGLVTNLPGSELQNPRQFVDTSSNFGRSNRRKAKLDPLAKIRTPAERLIGNTCKPRVPLPWQPARQLSCR